MIHQETTIKVNDVVYVPDTRTLAIVTEIEAGEAVLEWYEGDGGVYEPTRKKEERFDLERLIIKWTGAEIDLDRDQDKRGASGLGEKGYKKRYYEANKAKIQAKYREWYRNLPEDRKEAIRASRRKACLKCRAEKSV